MFLILHFWKLDQDFHWITSLIVDIQGEHVMLVPEVLALEVFSLTFVEAKRGEYMFRGSSIGFWFLGLFAIFGLM